MKNIISFLTILFALLGAIHGQTQNLILPANGGVLQSFTSEYGIGWSAAKLTDGITLQDGWASSTNPGAQEFIYSFNNSQAATLLEAVIHSGTGEGGKYFSKDVQVWTSLDGVNYTLAASGTLANSINSLTFNLGGVLALRVKLVITSGYATNYWELGEFTLNGTLGSASYPLTVNNGNGDGNYTSGATVNITANAPLAGQVFNFWGIISGTPSIANINNPATTLIMPQGAAEITAMYRALSSDATLSNLQVNGSTIIGFHTNAHNYGVVLPSGTTSVPIVSATASNSAASVIINQATGIPGQALITVRAEDGNTVVIYTVQFNIEIQQNLPITFESVPYRITNFDGGELTVINNPQQTALNTSAHVGQLIKGTGQHWAGAYITLSAPINFSTNQQISIKVFSPRAGVPVLLKLEHATNTSTSTQRTQNTTLANGWDSLTFDFSGAPSNVYSKVVLIFDLGVVGDGSSNFTFLIDNIQQFNNAPPTYPLTINNGTGDGNYSSGSIVTINADAAPAGQTFNTWLVNQGSPILANANASSTNLTMPASAAEITATYKPITYLLTVNSGIGDGLYTPGEVITIAAEQAPLGYVFDSWLINSGSPLIANTTATTTSLTMPSGIAEVTATYRVPSSDATLSSLSIAGSLPIENFQNNKFDYYISIANGTTQVPGITATTTSNRAQIIQVPAPAIPGTSSILVTAENGATLSYYVHFYTPASLCTGGLTGNLPGTTQYALVWEDDFTQNGPPCPNNWGYDLGNGGWGNNELQYYTNRIENAFVKDGVLNIKAIKENYQGSQYTSARLVTKDRFEFTYGRIDVRAKVPQQNGTWSAVWMLGAEHPQVPWPAVGEVDIMEHTGNNENTILGVTHNNAAYGAAGIGGSTYMATPNDFHIYSIEWDAEQIRFLVDNNQYFVYNPVSKTNDNYPYTSDFFLLMNVAMGGNLGGTIDPNFTNASMEIDYVKVYQKDSTLAIPVPLVGAPVPPARNASEVISIFSDAYANVAGTIFNPNWNQNTLVTTEVIAGNNTLKYANLNYQGTEFGSAINVSAMKTLHVDMWTAGATTVNLWCISSPINNNEISKAFSLELTPNQWVSYDIPLALFADVVNLTDLIQFKFEDPNGNNPPTIYLDNLYFHTVENTNDVFLSNLMVNGVTINGFISGKTDYTVVLPTGTTSVPAVTASALRLGTTVVVNPAPNLSQPTTIVLTSANQLVTKTYRINWVVQTPLLLPINFETGPYAITNFDGGVLSVITNPQPSGANASAKVGRMVKAVGQPWAGSYITLDQPVSFAEYQRITMKVFAPRANTAVTLKLEHATNMNSYVERTVTTSVANQWETISFNFTGSLSGLYSKAVIIFDNGIVGDGSSNFTYLIDDIEQTNGTYTLTVNYGTGNGSYLPNTNLVITANAAPLGQVFDRWVINSGNPTIANSSASTTTLTMPAGNTMISATYKARTNTLPVDFELEPYNITNFGGGTLSILSNPYPTGINTSAKVARIIKGAGEIWAGSYILLSETIDLTTQQGISLKMYSPRAGASVMLKLEHATDPNIFIERTLSTTVANSWETLSFDFAGAQSGLYSKIVFIVDLGALGDGSLNYTFYVDDIEPFNIMSHSIASLSDLRVNNTTIPGFNPNLLRYKMELPAGTTSIPLVVATASNPQATIAITPAIAIPGTTLVKVTAEDGRSMNTYSIQFTYPPADTLPINFETGPYSITNFDGGVLTVIPNPQPTGINTSARVARIVKGPGLLWAGSYITLPKEIDFSTQMGISLKVFSPRAGATVLLKLQNGSNDNIFIQKTLSTTVANQWETLSFYFPEAISDSYSKLVFIFDFGIMGDGSPNFTFLIDDIQQFGGSPAVYPLTINSGNGDGNYTSGDNVTIIANPSALGYEFDYWQVNSGAPLITDSTQPTTNLIMTAGSTIVTARYKPIPYTLIVNNGNGDGIYIVDSTVSVTADPPILGYEFDYWLIHSGGPSIANINASATNLTMAASNATITARYKQSLYPLTVTRGDGDGNYTYNTSVTIIADAPPYGMRFYRWVVNSGTPTIGSITSSSTTLIVPIGGASITATYRASIYQLTVNGGSGTGSYAYGTQVSITAAPAPVGHQFDRWVVNNGSPVIANSNSASTLLTIPANNVSITATYRLTNQSLTVNNGIGDGNYDYGTAVTIIADAPAVGMEFDRWVINLGNPAILDINSPLTTLTMSQGEVNITATFKNSVYPLEIINGTGGGNYTYGSSIAISANQAPAGYEFDVWTINFGTPVVANINAPATNMVMPAGPATLTAQYKASYYQLTVLGGSGNGSYVAGSSVTIVANPPMADMEFDRWIADSGNPTITDATKSSTTLNMSIGNTTIRATYKSILYGLIVNQGTGSGNYQSGSNVSIAANPAPIDMEFDRWVVSAGNPLIEDQRAPNTMVTMPSGSATITSTYKAMQHPLTVSNGNGSGQYETGTLVTITADAAPAGMEFDSWTIVSGMPVIVNVNVEITSLTVPMGGASVMATYKRLLNFSGAITSWTSGNALGNEATTQITPANASYPIVNVDDNGNFIWDITNGTSININRNLDNGTPVMPSINGFDAYLASKVTIEDTSFIPNVYQIIAMDVNRDGRVTAGDITQISQRAVGQIDKFVDDYLFIPNTTIVQNQSYQISANYPAADNKGYTRYAVPVVIDNIALPVEDSTGLLIIDREAYKALMLGDAGYAAPLSLKSADVNSTIIFDIENASIEGQMIEIPILINCQTELYSIDFSLDYNAAIMKFETVIDYAGIEETYSDNGANIKFTSYTKNNAINSQNKVLAMRFSLLTQKISNKDLRAVIALFNGIAVNSTIKGEINIDSGTNTSITGSNNVIIYPNPSSSFVNVTFNGVADVSLINLKGQVIDQFKNANGSITLDVSQLSTGSYTVVIGDSPYQVIVVEE